jgi:hypothetical protein
MGGLFKKNKNKQLKKTKKLWDLLAETTRPFKPHPQIYKSPPEPPPPHIHGRDNIFLNCTRRLISLTLTNNPIFMILMFLGWRGSPTELNRDDL